MLTCANGQHGTVNILLEEGANITLKDYVMLFDLQFENVALVCAVGHA